MRKYIVLCCLEVVFLFGLCRTVSGNNFDSTLGHIKTNTEDGVQKSAIEDLIKRLIPSRFEEFSTTVDSDFVIDGKDAFKVEKINQKIHITGTTGVMVASGLHYYLKYFCNCHISWESSQLHLPKYLPDVNVTIKYLDRFRYYQNVCTTSYSFVWWGWDQWEKHIDWMALNSFNLVLAFHGQEAIWKRVYTKLNLTQGNIDEHFTGPAYLSWLRMGNMRGWGGPLSDAWHTRSLSLQKKILERMRLLGIVPVLPAFAGHLPRAFKRLFPNTTMTKMEVWNHFNDTYCCPYFLDPTETLFKTIGSLFLQEQIAEFGTDHVYNCDSFNEVDPSTTNLTYLANVGKSIYSAMTEVDPQAIWLMQGWLFYSSVYWSSRQRVKSFVTSVPTGKMIILDLQSEEFPQYNRLDQYFGQPYIWCMLHNFGGTLGMYGSAKIINENVIEARNAENSTMIGTGLTMEGINQNYVIYDLMTETSWRSQPTNLTDWFRNYSRRRYGTSNENVEKAWQILKESVYNFTGVEKIRGKYAVTTTPSLLLQTWTWYKYSSVFKAWDDFISAADDLKNSSGFLHDLTDVTRQVLQVNGDIYYNKLLNAFFSGSKKDFQVAADIFRNIFLDMEAILASNENFLLGNWLESAKNCAYNAKEELQFEYNARNQITLWGPNGEIMNYAIKQWSGVVKDFLHPRWIMFIDAMNKTITQNVTFNEKLLKEQMFKNVEEPFTFSRTLYPTKPIGDTVTIAKQIHQKYWYSNTNIIPEAKKLPLKKRKSLLRRYGVLKSFKKNGV